jgi:hypothetical protein
VRWNEVRRYQRFVVEGERTEKGWHLMECSDWELVWYPVPVQFRASCIDRAERELGGEDGIQQDIAD